MSIPARRIPFLVTQDHSASLDPSAPGGRPFSLLALRNRTSGQRKGERMTPERPDPRIALYRPFVGPGYTVSHFSGHKLFLSEASTSNTWRPSKNKLVVLPELVTSRIPIRPRSLALRGGLSGQLEDSYATGRGRRSFGNSGYALHRHLARVFLVGGNYHISISMSACKVSERKQSRKRSLLGFVAQIAKLETTIGCGYQYARSFRPVHSRLTQGIPRIYRNCQRYANIYTIELGEVDCFVDREQGRICRMPGESLPSWLCDSDSAMNSADEEELREGGAVLSYFWKESLYDCTATVRYANQLGSSLGLRPKQTIHDPGTKFVCTGKRSTKGNEQFYAISCVGAAPSRFRACWYEKAKGRVHALDGVSEISMVHVKVFLCDRFVKRGGRQTLRRTSRTTSLRRAAYSRQCVDPWATRKWLSARQSPRRPHRSMCRWGKSPPWILTWSSSDGVGDEAMKRHLHERLDDRSWLLSEVPRGAFIDSMEVQARVRVRK
ncbi:hypothetical protein H4582DRAFT_2056182 [Lactarius indigo]|nr:hypothetical protein H4582DRAFT_2056182 [Lactarius indigo]